MKMRDGGGASLLPLQETRSFAGILEYLSGG